jgi:spoIIIJ-associated protein
LFKELSMNPNRFVETTGDSVEEAVAKGLAELGVGPAEVIIEVLEEASRGVFGLGGHPAKVRLQLLTMPKPAAPPPPPATMPEEDDERIEIPNSTPPPRRPRSDETQAERRQPRERVRKPADDYEVSEEDQGLLVEADEVPESEQDDEAQIAKVVLGELLDKMEIHARIVVRRAKPGEPEEVVPWVLDVMGGNLNRLIGRRGETLASLQYITRLITSRELQRRSEVVVDIGGYKARRAQTLHALALRMADEAVQRNHTVSLEPMPPHERRIIHLALRERTDVTTRSIGEGAARKVTIVPSSQE